MHSDVKVARAGTIKYDMIAKDSYSYTSLFSILLYNHCLGSPLIIFPTLQELLSYISEIKDVLCLQRVSLPLKKRRDIFSEGFAAHPVGYNSPLQIKLAIRHIS
jgi:hypothetical protein